MQIKITTESGVIDIPVRLVGEKVWIISNSSTSFFSEKRVYRAVINSINVSIDVDEKISVFYSVKASRAFTDRILSSDSVFSERTTALEVLKLRNRYSGGGRA
jgi:hypothetical protein